jgi:hypothetical protein
MRERVEVAARRVFDACSVPGKCLVGTLTLLLGAICLAEALVVPSLFGPVAATVIACERLLCAARSSSTRAAAVWTGVAFGWVVVASSMVHSPLVTVSALRWLLVLLIASSTLCRLRVSLTLSASGSAPAGIWLLAAGISIQLATLFGATVAPPSRVAAAAALELVLIGSLSLLRAANEHLAAHRVVRSDPRASARERLVATMIELESKIA